MVKKLEATKVGVLGIYIYIYLGGERFLTRYPDFKFNPAVAPHVSHEIESECLLL